MTETSSGKKPTETTKLPSELHLTEASASKKQALADKTVPTPEGEADDILEDLNSRGKVNKNAVTTQS